LKTSNVQANTMKAKPTEQHAKQYPLRLARSLQAAAKLVAEREGVSVNHFISLAVAEKISRIEQENSAPPEAKRAT
jgi:predicted HicB family RNase H-like nuclease